MNGSRIWIDLSAFFSCVRKHSCIYVDHEKFRTVKDVENHICRLFGLKQGIQIVSEGALLPGSESSLLLRDNDTVSVVYEEEPKPIPLDVTAKGAPAASKSNDALSASKAKDVNEVFKPPPEPSPLTDDTKSRQHAVINGNGPVAVTGNIPSILKSSIKNPFAAVPPPPLDFVKNSVAEQTPENGVSVTDETPPVFEDYETSSELGSASKKRKRIRRRKKKSATETNDEPMKTIEDPKEIKRKQYHTNRLLQSVSYTLNRALDDNASTQQHSNTATVNGVPKVNNGRKHIFFDDPGDEEMKTAPLTEKPTDGKESVVSVQSKDAIQVPVPVPEEPKNVNEVTLPEESTSSRISSPARGNGAVGLEKLLSLGNQKSPAVFERKKAEIPPKNEVNLKFNVVASEQKIKKFTPLNDLPVKETIIQFKVLKMCNYSPTISDLITARVISPDFTKRQIFVQITEGLEELKTEKGKFSLDPEDILDDNETISDYLLLDWHDLIEPKAMEYS